MKNYLTQFFLSVILNSAKRLAVLFMFLSFTAMSFAGHGGPHNATVTPQANPQTGAGSVYVSKNSNYSDKSLSPLSYDCGKNESGHDMKTFYLLAEPLKGYDVKSWDNSDGVLSGNDERKPTISIDWSAKKKDNVSATATAYFTPIISTTGGDVESGVFSEVVSYPIEKKTETETEIIKEDLYINLYKATDISYDIQYTSHDSKDDPNRKNYLYCELSSDGHIVETNKLSETGSYKVKVTVDSKATVEDQATITLTAKWKDENDKFQDITTIIYITIEGKTKVTFKSNDKISYKAVSRENTGNVLTEVDKNAADTTFEIEERGDRKLTLIATSVDDGYRFYRWKVTRKAVGEAPRKVEYYYNHQESTDLGNCNSNYDVKDGDLVEVEAIKDGTNDGYARFRVEGTETTYHDNLQDAADYALVVSDINKRIIYVDNSGNVLRSDGEYYTIPVGVTLLVPGDSTKTRCPIGEYPSTHYSNFEVRNTFDRIKYLTLDDYTKINVSGNICVNGQLSCNQYAIAKPYRYGQLSMGNNCQIILESGSKLMAYGYITCKYDDEKRPTSEIIARNGSHVYEAMQMRDWPGGERALDYHNNGNKKVFYTGQYYIQNIETKLRIEFGAIETVCSAAYITLSGTTPIKQTFVSNTNNTFLKLVSDNAVFEKYYEPEKDSLLISLLCSEADSIAEVELANMSYDVKASFIKSFTVNSSNYVFPINMNIGISLKDVNFTMKYDMALLAGSHLEIDENSSLILDGGNLYVYDLDQHSTSRHSTQQMVNGEYYWGFFRAGQNNSAIINSLPHRPGNMKITRTVNADAWIDVRGMIKVKAGNLYTTGYPLNPDGTPINSTYNPKKNPNNDTKYYDGPGGAAIKCTTSSGRGGVIDFSEATKINEPNYVTYQVHHIKDGITFIDLPVTLSRLQNADSSYVGPITDTVIYTYRNGSWGVDTDLALNSTSVSEDESFEFYIPNTTEEPVTRTKNIILTFNGDASSLNLKAELSDNSDKFSVDTPTIQSDDNTKIIIPVTYTQSNEHGEYNDTISVTVVSGNLSDTIPDIPITAKEDYYPNFNCDSLKLQFKKNLCNQNVLTDSVKINPSENNVTTILNSINDWDATIIYPEGTEESHKIYSAELRIDANEGDLYVDVTYNPNDEVESSAILRITAKSNYAVDSVKPLTKSCDIALTGTASLCPNPLTFKPNIVDGVIQLFVGEQVDLLDSLGYGAEIPLDSIVFDTTYIAISPNGNNFTITAKKVTPDNQATGIVVKQGAANGYGAANISVDVVVLSAVTWNWNVLYYGCTHTNPLKVNGLIADGVLQIHAEDNSNNIIELLTLTKGEQQYDYTLKVGENLIEEDTVIFNFTSNDHNLDYDFPAILSDLRLLTACVSDTASYTALNLAQHGVSFAEGDISDTIYFQSSDNEPYLTLQFYGTPSKVTFTPTGKSRWRVEQGATSDELQVISGANWTTYRENEPVTILLDPQSRFVKFRYTKGANQGSLRDLCIHKLEIEADAQTIYLPVAQGNLTPSTKHLMIKHSTDNVPTFDGLPDGVTCVPINEHPERFDGYYQTTFKLSATKTGTYTITAREGRNSTSIKVIAFDFPMGLPIKTDEWKDSTDKANYYHFYVEESRNAHWWHDSINPYIVFENTGSDSISRSVTFAFEGAPSVIKFNYDDGSQVIRSQEWNVEECNIQGSWSTAKGAKINGTYFEQELQHTTRRVRLSHNGSSYGESKISNLIIEGYPKTIITPDSLNLNNSSDTSHISKFKITAINLQDIQIKVDNPSFLLEYTYQDATGDTVVSTANDSTIVLTESECPAALGTNKVGDIVIKVTWDKSASVSHGIVSITNKNATPDTVKLIGSKGYINSTNTNTGIWTGKNPRYTLRGDGSTFEPYTHHHVDVKNAFANGKALFDYMIIYGETTTKDGSNIIFEPDAKSGSNALTPYYIYQRKDDAYELMHIAENANSPDKVLRVIELKEEFSNSVSAYITGFCPYATTGYTSEDEGVWYFRGPAGSRIDLYLDSCHIYSRNKSKTGQKYGKNDADASTFNAAGVQGSGAVFVFENKITNYESAASSGALEVAIHTINHNVVKSNYGAYLNAFGAMDGRLLVAQVSAAVQVRLGCRIEGNNEIYDYDYQLAKTILDFDDHWPQTPKRDNDGKFTNTYHTNGFLSLQKQQNYAPSIDIGNANTEVNFRGGQVELQNAAIQSPNYKTTLAISHRTGIMGNIKDFRFSYGLGTDDVGGTVSFYDGTVTVKDLYVDEVYKDFYLLDKDENGTEIYREKADSKKQYLTTCLRTPSKTYIYGGSHCNIRACNWVTSTGGAPTDGINPLGRYEYTLQLEKSDEIVTPDSIKTNGLAKVNNFPKDSSKLKEYYQQLPESKKYQYGLESVSPVNNKLYFWIPEVDSVNYPVDTEVDQELHYWLACMTEIVGGALGVEANVGGEMFIDDNDLIRNLLYCQLDDDIHSVISKNDSAETPIYSYNAPAILPVSDPNNPDYTTVSLAYVSDYKQHNIIRAKNYKVTNKIYYITTAKTDTWMSFTLPFDVSKLYIVESYNEDTIAQYFENYTPSKSVKGDSKMKGTMKYQAFHNADFAAFFGMAMAIGQIGKDFDLIYQDYIRWAYYMDTPLPSSDETPNTISAYASSTDNLYARVHGNYTGDFAYYNWRGMYELEHYDGSNFFTANYYLYHNTGDWSMSKTNVLDSKWEVAPSATKNDGILMNKGKTYSMLFPYCTGCDAVYDEDGELDYYAERNYWDYWSGKLLIFESTQATDSVPHIVNGSDYLAAERVENAPCIFDDFKNITIENTAVITGNSTFSAMALDDMSYENVRGNTYIYNAARHEERFISSKDNKTNTYATIQPVETILMMNSSTKSRIKHITRDGQIVTEEDNQGNNNQGTPTGGHVPTVGGGSDMFITGTDNGINVAVASPQMVYVVTTTGAVIYSGYVESDINIPLPISGIYLIKGENEVQKIFY